MDFVEILNAEFQKRQTKNPRYSLRAFAQHLGIQSATLSAVLKRKRALPVQKTLGVMSDLKFSKVQKNRILKSLKSPLAVTPLKEFYERPQLSIEESTTAVVTEWEYCAVISLCKLKNFKPDEKWIAKRLGLPLERSRMVWNTLIELKLIQADELGKYKACYENLRITTKIPSETLRKGHQTELELAQKKLEAVPMHQRNYTSLTFAMSSKNMAKANDLIRQFIQQMENNLERGVMDEVYQLGIQLYPLTEMEK